MIIDGKLIASEILSSLTTKVTALKTKNIIPVMAVILMGNNESSGRYVRQKEIKAREIGAEVKLFHIKDGITNEKIEKLVKKLINDPKIHGIILQRPAPEDIKANELTELIPGIKEVDGFGSNSIYPVPVAQAVIEMLKFVYKKEAVKASFSEWLKSCKIIVLGKGETAGKPIIEHLFRIGANPTAIDSKTQNKDSLIKDADIIVSAVGKKVIDAKQIKKSAILIGVGLFTNSEGKLKGDYDDGEVESIASYYSPTPGGVGPVNVACLLENLVNAATKSHS